MSTYVHAAAMGLLSRTVQTLLSKYLIDVDVQGVAMPSYFGSSNSNNNSSHGDTNGGGRNTNNGSGGSSGGWGVRLKNVKVREGTKLMELPGGIGTAADAAGRRRRRRQQKCDRQRPRQQQRKQKQNNTSESRRRDVKTSAAVNNDTNNSKNNSINYLDADDSSLLRSNNGPQSPSPSQQQVEEEEPHEVPQPPYNSNDHRYPHAAAAPTSSSSSSSGVHRQAAVTLADDDDDDTAAAAPTQTHARTPQHNADSKPAAADTVHSHTGGYWSSFVPSWLSSSSNKEDDDAVNYHSPCDPSSSSSTGRERDKDALGQQQRRRQQQSSHNTNYHANDNNNKYDNDNHERSSSTNSGDLRILQEACMPPLTTSTTTMSPSTHSRRHRCGHSPENDDDDDPLTGPLYGRRRRHCPTTAATPVIPGGGGWQNEDGEEAGYYDVTTVANNDDDASNHGQRTTRPTSVASDEHDIDDDHDDFRRFPMILRMGNAGTIGTLDVRLVGKSLHILVEDAVLTVEAVRVRQATGADTTTTTKPSSTSNPHTTSSSNQPTKTTAAGPTTRTTSSSTTTTGDRVMAEQRIARMLSALPNLLLRDVRVRLVVRDEMMATTTGLQCEEDGDGAVPVDQDYADTDAVLDVAIDLLSIAEGQDVLLNFGDIFEDNNHNHVEDDDDTDDDDDDSTEDDDQSRDAYESGGMISTADVTSGSAAAGDSHEYLAKRIRTGRGPEGGVLVKIYEARYILSQSASDLQSAAPDHLVSPCNPPWARQSYLDSTQCVLLRLSGLDIHARMYLGTKKEISVAKQGWYVDESGYDDFSVDAMLFGGVDYIVPGPQPKHPPMVNHTLAENISIDDSWVHPGASIFFKDDNGIQSCRLPSAFHKVARGLHSQTCSMNHLPCEYCHNCWTSDAGSSKSHAMDMCTPLCGLVFHVSIRDPLEINADRDSLEVLGLILNLFSKKETASEPHPSQNKDAHVPEQIHTASERSFKSRTSLRAHSAIDDSVHTFDESCRSHGNESLSSARSTRNRPTKTYKDYNVDKSFPTYFQPEKVQTLGLYIAEIKIRLHVFRGDKQEEIENAFCFWDLQGYCVTMDQQKSTAVEIPFQDLRFEVGHLVVDEYKGVERKQLVCLGSRRSRSAHDDVSLETFITSGKSHNRSPWPSAAAALLDVLPPLESLLYEDRDCHGIQMRYISILYQEKERHRVRRNLHAHLGTASVDVPFAIRFIIPRLVQDSIATVVGRKKSVVNPVLQPKVDSCLLYKVMAIGGNVCIEPLIRGSIPRVTVKGELSSGAGFSLSSVLDQLKFTYGVPSGIRALDQGLSLQQLANLPDKVRLRVLLFLKDLMPLEAALDLDHSSNPFLRCRNVNRGIVKRAKSQSKHSNSTLIVIKDEDAARRRESLLQELSTLDNSTLECLLQNRRIEHASASVTG